MAETTKTARAAAPAKASLPNSVFEVEVPNHELLKLAYDAFLANSRKSSATTLQRGEVRGGGKKPWKQKGTGRARFGSSRNPIWRGGGVVFGPRGNENYSIKISKTAKIVALRQALTLAKQADKIQIADITTTGKTSEVAKFFADNKFHEDAKVLIVVDEKTPEIMRATNNLQNALLVRATYLSVYYILNADVIVMSNAAVKAVEKWLQPYTREDA